MLAARHGRRPSRSRTAAAWLSVLLLAAPILASPHAGAPTAAAATVEAEGGTSADGAAEAAWADGDGAAAEPAASGVASVLDGAGADDPGAREERPVTSSGAAGTVEGDVLYALAADGEAPVLIELAAQADLDGVAAEASRAGRERAREARERARERGAPGGEVAAEARRAAHAARVGTVVAALQETARASQEPVARLLAEEEAAGRARAVRDHWIVNAFAAVVDPAALERVASHPHVARVALDAEVEVPETDSGPRLPTWSLEAVGAPDTWGEYGFTGDGVVVGVLDTGVDGGHPALAGRYRGRDGDHDRAWYVPTGENYPEPGDGHGHGTHVTGSIVGGPPGEVVGVAPGAEWVGVKIFRNSGTTSTSIIRDGMQWVLAPGGDPSAAPHVVNNSWGAANPASTEYWDEVAAWVAAGIFPVFANGNSGPGAGTVGSPASFPHSFGVGATDRHDAIAPFSSRGPAFWDGEAHRKPEVSAPGHEIRSAWPRRSGMDYHTISGTSMAAPHAAGVAALALQAQPDLTLDDLRDVLQSTARSGDHMGGVPNDSYGHGIVDAYAAVTRARFSGTLAGTVSGPDGPIEATVRVPGLGASTVSDPDTGDYELVVREGGWRAVADAYGFLPGEHVVTVTAGEVTTADFALAAAPEHTLTGTVVAGSDPLPGARVEVHGTPLEPAVTGAGGRFAFDVAEGTYELRVRAHGYAPAAEAITVDGDDDLTITLEPLDQAAAEQWPEYQNNPARTGFSDEEAVPDSFERLWSANLGAPVQFSSPVAAGGSVYVTTDDGRLHALDAGDGSVRWTHTAGATLRSTPAVAGDRVYLAGGDDGTLYALDATDGSVEWTHSTGDRLTYSTPTVVGSTVYLTGGFGPGDGGVLYAIDAGTGARRWSVDVGPQIFFGPTVGDGTVFAASRETGRLVAVDADSGEERWSRQLDDGPLSMPAYDAGTLYVGTTRSGGGSLLAIDAATGELRWEVADHGDSQGSSAAVYGDLLVVGAHEPAAVAAYDRDSGERLWRHAAGLAVSAAQLVTAGGVVLGGSQDGGVWALDATTGALLWEDELTGNVLAAPALAGGVAVFADNRGVLAAYTSTGTLTGTVTGPGGPLDATVALVGTGTSTVSDADTGAYSLTHRPGDYEIEARRYGHETERASARLRPGLTTELDFVLEPVGDGALAGTVTDTAGQPLAGAEVRLSGTPLDPATTDAAGSYRFDAVAAGTYELVADASGYAPDSRTVEIAEGGEHEADFALQRFDVAVVADHEGAITGVLSEHGLLAEQVTFEQIAGTVANYGAIVVNGSGADRADADLDRFAAIVDDADAGEVSVVFLDQWSVSYGSIRSLSAVTGDPSTFNTAQRRGPVSLVARGDHPITASLPAGERVQILSSNSDHASFSGYSGRVLADLHAEQTGTAGAGIGYQRRTLGSAHVLLPSHAATPWAGPDRTWLPPARQVLLDAVDHALAADYGAVAGTITGEGGEPVAARVTVAETGEGTRAGGDGAYELVLEPGTYTLRFSHVGSVTAERDVEIVAGETVALDVALAGSGLGTIAGTVTERASGAPVAGAEVAVADTSLATTAEADGAYAIDDVPGGAYDVTVTADGYLTATAEGVSVTEGEVTGLDFALDLAPRVGVMGDRLRHLTDFLLAGDIEASEVGWDVTDDLSGFDVIVLNNPTDPGREGFLAALEAFDDAGVSVVVGADGWSTRTRGAFLFANHLGDPAGYGRIGGFNGPPLSYHDLADHPLFAGVEDPVEILTGNSESATIEGYSGLRLADVAEEGAEPAGVGMAYKPRTPTSVHLFVGGLAATFRNSPGGNWTPQGRDLYLSAIRWAAAPTLGVVEGAVLDADEEPIDGAHVRVAETGLDATTGEDGAFSIPHPAGDYTLEASAFGYDGDTLAVSVAAGETVDVTITLDVGDVGGVAGTVTSTGDVRPQDGAAGVPVEGATVRLRGTPRTAVTAADGSYTLPRVEPGTYELEVVADGHVRTVVADVEVVAGEVAGADVALRPSPAVGVIDDFNDHAKGYLAHWGWQPEDLAWTDLERIADLDLVVANLASFPNLDPGAAGWRAFADAADRARVPVVWLDQFGRGAIQWLRDYEDDPAVREQGRGDGAVTATVADGHHPLFAGLPAAFELTESGREHAWFGDYSGVTAATLSTGAGGERGGAVGYRGRTSASVDVLLSTLSISTYGHLPYGDEPGSRYTPEAERLFRNALEWALDAPALAAEARGTVRDEAGARIASDVTVVETGKTYDGRDGDGTFVVPLQPGSWTLEVTAFGYRPATVDVTVEAGDVVRPDVTLAGAAAGDLQGRVTDPVGDPIEGAAVSVIDTPRAADTGPDGRWSITRVPAGDWTVEVRAAGFMATRADVTVTDGGTHTVDIALEPSRAIAVAGDQGTHIADLLEGEGYEVHAYAYNAISEITARIADYPLVVLNGRGTRPSAEAFTSLLDAAADHEVSVLMAGQFGSGSIRDARDWIGDPETVSWTFTASPIYYDVAEPHPIFAGLDITEPIELMRDAGGGNQQYLLFDGYSGTTVADLDAPARGDRAGGVGYRFTSPRSVHVLLASLQATIDAHGNPGTNWTDEAKAIYLNAVTWAIDAAQAEIHGTVTSGGEPLAGASVEAVEAGASARTADDGSYSLGVADGEHTVRVALHGYKTAETTVAVGPSERVRADFDLEPVARGALEVTVTDLDGAGLAGAEVELRGPVDEDARTSDSGVAVFDDLLEGTYTVAVSATGYLPAETEATVTGGDVTRLDVALVANDVAVIGDVDGALVEFLRDAGIAAEERGWDVAGDVERYDVVLVGDASASEAELVGLLEAADAAATSLVLTGTWGVNHGGIRALERHTGDVDIGGHGYGDGAVELAGFDAAHPLFDGLDDPVPILADDSHYSWLDRYVGHYLADLHVGGEAAGVAVAYDFRSSEHLHLLVSMGAVSPYVGPGYGWTEDTGRLMRNAVEWARTAEQEPPATPTITAADDLVATPAITVSGEAEFRSTVEIVRDGDVLASAEPDRNGNYEVEVELVEGENPLVATAANHAGTADSEPLVVRLDTTGPQLDWTPADGEGFLDATVTVAGTVTDEPAGVAEVRLDGEPVEVDGDGSFAVEVELGEGERTFELLATDTLGNTTVEQRTVALLPLEAEWELPPDTEPRPATNVRLGVRDLDGTPTPVDGALLEAHASDGTVHGPYEMRWADERYQHVLRGLPAGEYALAARLDVDGWAVTLHGPTVRAR